MILLILGIVLLIFPPRYSLGRQFNLVFAALVCLVAADFLPVSWFAVPAWRVTAVQDYSFHLGPCLTPQPWVTAEAFVLLVAGLSWCYIVSVGASKWDSRAALPIFCAGVILLAALSICIFLTGSRWPFGNTSQTIFGPFPNRNQTANVLAVGAILSVGLLYEQFRNGSRSWPFWFCGCLILYWGLALVGARAGIVIYFLGSTIWFGCVAVARKQYAWLAVGVGLLFSVLGGFLFTGGPTVARFLSEVGGRGHGVIDRRWLIQSDAFDLANSVPWFGAGLGNFDSVFALTPHRALGSVNLPIIHPESDWLWLAAEAGWLSVLVVITGICLWGRRILPLTIGPDGRLRAAAGSAVIVFALHSFVDVPAHRIGSVFPIIFVSSLALCARKEAIAPLWLPTLFRALGGSFCLIGCLWIAAVAFDVPFPGTIGALLADRHADRVERLEEYDKASRLSTAAIGWAPLLWQPYYHRAVSLVFGSSNSESAMADFRRARFLNPTSPELPFEEGFIWLDRNSPLALAAWQEAIRRAGPSRAIYYRRLLTSSLPSDLQDGLIETAAGDSQLLLIAALQMPPAKFRDALSRLLLVDPSLETLSKLQLRELFYVWRLRCGPSDFSAQMGRHEAWMEAGWVFVAEAYATNGDYQRAYQLALRYFQPPTMPPAPMQTAAPDLRRRIFLSPNDFSAGYALYLDAIDKMDTGTALSILHKMTVQQDCPKYFHYLEANIQAQAGQWKYAWQCLVLAGIH